MNVMRVYFLLFLSLTVPVLSEAADTLPTQINLEKGWDSEQGRDYFIDADINLGGPRLSIGYGESDSQYEATVLDTTTRQFSFSSNPLSDISTSMGYSEWGQEGEINIRSYRLDFVFNTGNWSLSVGPQTRDIEVHTLLMFIPVIDMDSNGTNLGISYYGARWNIGLNYSEHDYSRNVAILATDPRLGLIFSPVTMEHAYGFEKNRISTDFGYLLNWGSMGMDYLHSVSAVDDSVSTATAIYMRYKIDNNWNISLRGGQSDNSFSMQKTTFATLGLGYQF